MTISFNEISPNQRVPLLAVEVDNSLANSYSQNLKTLLISETPNAVSEVPTLVINADDVAEKFGVDSPAHKAAKSYFLNNKINELWVLPLNDVDPVLDQTHIDSIGDLDFEFWMSTVKDTTSLGFLQLELLRRWEAQSMLYGHLFIANEQTNVATQVAYGESFNDQHVTVIGTSNSVDGEEVTLGGYVGQVASSYTIDPARPTQTLAIKGLTTVIPDLRLKTSTNEILLNAGISPLDSMSGHVRIIRTITTYRKNSLNVDDISYLDANTLFTLAQVIRRLQSVITSKFARVKLVNNGTLIPVGSATVTPSVIRVELISIYDDLINLGLTENAEAFEETLVVERNADNPNRLDVQIQPDLANQLRVVAVKTSFRLNF